MTDNLPSTEVMCSEDFKLPKPPENIEAENAIAVRDAINGNAIKIRNRVAGTLSVETAISYTGVNGVLGLTDDETRIFISNLDDDDKYDGSVMTPALQEKLFEQAEIASTQEERDSKADAMICLQAMAQNHDIQTERALLQEELDAKWPAFREKMLSESLSGNCAISESEPLGEDKDLHHDPRRSDKPEHTLDPNSVFPVNSSSHRKHHGDTRKKSNSRLQEQRSLAKQVVGKEIKGSSS